MNDDGWKFPDVLLFCAFSGLLTSFSLEQKGNPPAHHLLPLGNPAGRRDLTFDTCSHLQQRVNSRGNAWTCTFIL